MANLPAPFSDPTVRNDYYTYDYHIPAGLKTEMTLKSGLPALRRTPGTLRFTAPDGTVLEPLYDLHRRRYTVYWHISE